MSYYQPPPPAGTPYDPNYGQNAAPSTTNQSPLTEFLTLASKGTRTRDWPTWMYGSEPENRAKRDQVLSMLTDRGSSASSPELHAALMPLRQFANADLEGVPGGYRNEGDPMAQMNNIYRTLSSPSMSMKGMLEKAIGASGPANPDPNFTPPPPAQSLGQGGLLDTLRGAGGGGGLTRSPVGTGPGQTGMFTASAPGVFGTGQPGPNSRMGPMTPEEEARFNAAKPMPFPTWNPNQAGQFPQGSAPGASQGGVGVGGPAGMQGLLQMLMKLFQGGGMNNQQTPRMW